MRKTTATRTTSSMLSVTAQQPEPSVQSAIAKPSVFSTCLGTMRPKKAAPKTARITSAMIFFMSPSSPLSNLGRPEIHLREAERIQQPVRRLAPSTCKHQTKGIPESRSSMRRADRSRRANPMLGAAKSADVRMAGVSQSARGETTRRIATIAWRISAGVALAYSSATRPGGYGMNARAPLVWRGGASA